MDVSLVFCEVLIKFHLFTAEHSRFTGFGRVHGEWRLLVASGAGDGALKLGKVVQENRKGLRHHCPDLLLKHGQLGTVAQVFGDMEGRAINGATERLVGDCDLLEIG